MENSGKFQSTIELLNSSPLDTVFCVGPGYSREELKSVLLKKHKVLFGKIIYSPIELALKISGIDPKKVLSSKAAREELYEAVLKKISSDSIPELKRLKRRKSFFKALDKALQQGRLAYSNEAELDAILSLCHNDEGRMRLQHEIIHFARVWEKYLEYEGLVDTPMVYAQASARMKNGEWNENKKFVLLQGNPLDTLESAFWNEVSRNVREFHRFQEEEKTERSLARYRVHSPFECVETVADECALAVADGKNPIVLLPDVPEWRQLFMNALSVRKIPIHDSRNPGALRLSETLKNALLPFRVAATRAERLLWLEYVRVFQDSTTFSSLEKELATIGFRNGREFCLKKNPELEPFFNRMTVHEARALHLSVCKDEEITDVLTKLWDSIEGSTKTLQQLNRRFPAQHWVLKLQNRLEELKPSPDTFRPKRCVVIHRLGQYPLVSEGAPVFVLGLPSEWAMGIDAGDWLFNERERERLSTEFQLKSNSAVRVSRLQSLKAWIDRSGEVFSYEPQVSVDGKELESITWVWKAIQAGYEVHEVLHHPRWSLSYVPELSTPETHIQLDKLPQPTSSITALDWQSRCGFLGLLFGRWKAEDVKQPGFTPWPDFRGTLLHRAAREMIEKNAAAEDALETALKENTWKGMFRAPRTVSRMKQELLNVLNAFAKKESEYRERSGSIPKYFEGPALKLDIGGLTIHGRPDRIDEHAEGYFVIDYKTSSHVPSGEDMVNLGYRVQLPFYAIAFEKLFQKKMLAGQFVELTKDAKRTHGILPAALNGKKPGQLSNSRAKRSVLQGESEEFWNKSLTHIERVVSEFQRGEHKAFPVLENECTDCMARNSCGRSRQDAHP